VKGRSDLGILLTDVDDRVLGRVWVAFGGSVDVPSDESLSDGNVEIQAEVCSEVVDPPVDLEVWVSDR
jgi:hypothetical protein